MMLERSIGGPDRKSPGRPDGELGPGAWAEVILGLVYPPVCVVCRLERAGRHHGYVCDTCQNGVRRITDPCCQRCGIPFSGTIIGSHTCAACRRGSWAWDEARAAVIAEGLALECIHRLKYQKEPWFGTFLSGLLMESALPRLLGHPWQGVVPVPLHRVKLREREFNRIRNMRAAFEPARSPRIHGSWIIVDDVLTTGATTDGVAAVLKDLGAERVVVWAVARATLEGDLLPARQA
jgi:predicted amidophosphoribosyltransferase